MGCDKTDVARSASMLNQAQARIAELECQRQDDAVEMSAELKSADRKALRWQRQFQDSELARVGAEAEVERLRGALQRLGRELCDHCPVDHLCPTSIDEGSTVCVDLLNDGLDAGDRAQGMTEREEQYMVQLAGVSTAAMGATNDPAAKGDYGWSLAYEDTLTLRRRYDDDRHRRDANKLRTERDEARAEVERLRDETAKESFTTSGSHLGVVRRWIQWNCRNGERVTWGSTDRLQREFTVRDLEELAERVREELAAAADTPPTETTAPGPAGE